MPIVPTTSPTGYPEPRTTLRMFDAPGQAVPDNRSWIDHRGDRIHLDSVPLSARDRSQALIIEGWSVMRLDDCYQCYRVEIGGADTVRT